MCHVIMPIQNLHCEAKKVSKSKRRDNGAWFGDVDDLTVATYHAMGLKELDNGVSGKPRFLTLLSSLLERSVEENETSEIKDVVTVFHGERAPPLSIEDYIDRIYKYAGCSPSCFVVAYIYVDRYLQRTDALLTSFNIHRLLITSIAVAAKFIDDTFFNNAYYARVGGVSTIEMNRLEMKFLFSIDFRLRVSVETFQRYCSQLEKGAGECQIDRPIKLCGTNESWSTKDDSSPCSVTVAR